MASVLLSWYTDSPAISELEHGINLAKATQAKSILILSCSQNNHQPAQIDPLLKELNVTVFGGIYPMLIHQDKLLEQGSLVIAFAEKFCVDNFLQLSTAINLEQLEEIINQKQCSSIHAKDNFLMFYDGLLKNCEDFIDYLFEFLDHEVTIAGGGAGNLDFIQAPCVFTNQGLVSDTVQLVTLPDKLTTGVAHGWEVLQGPFLVSESQGQVVQSLNYLPAYTSYRESIESLTDYRFDQEDFFSIAKNFPLGIMNINKELIVRDPILTFNNSIQCVGNIPVNTMIYLLHGNTDNLVASAKSAAKVACQTQQQNANTLVFDCISRKLFMEEDFSNELSAIATQCNKETLVGVLSLGEVANSQSGAIRLLNKSTVVSSF